MKVKRHANGALIVGKEEFEAARRYLREHSGIDFDRFWTEATADALLRRPIGPTTTCLCMDEIEALSGPPAVAIPEPRLSAVKAHLLTCPDCQASLRLFRELEAASVRGLSKEPGFVLDSWAFLRREAGAVALDLTLLPRGFLPSTSAIVEPSVRLAGAISAQGCTVSAIDFPESSVQGLRATFHPEQVPEMIDAGPVCDWVDLKGELESGQTFRVRSLVCISGKPRVSWR